MTVAEKIAACLERLWTSVPEQRQAAVLMEWFAFGEIDAETYCGVVEALQLDAEIVAGGVH